MGETTAVALREADALPVWNQQQVVAQVSLIQNIMASVMHKDEHYGIIPGTQKPTLLKPGAEKLCLTFRLAPTYTIQEADLGSGHREYRVTCRLTSIQSGAVIGDGVGVCSSMESKYRYRHADPEDTGKPVPSGYWDAKKAGQLDKATAALGGKGCIAKKNAANLWTIHKMSAAKVENPDIADTYNTILKMAKKRAHVDATITALAVSDMFTQDMEDFAPVVAPAVPESPAVHPPVIDVEPAPPPEPVFILVDWEQDLANAPTIAALKDLWARAQRSPEWAQCTKAMHDRWERVKDDRKAALA